MKHPLSQMSFTANQSDVITVICSLFVHKLHVALVCDSNMPFSETETLSKVYDSLSFDRNHNF